MIKKLNKLNVFQSITLGFMGVIIIGVILLSLPISTFDNKSIGFLDALYISTSATCVTGQSIFESMDVFNYFGKTIILILIEVGGLGFMSVIVMLYSLLKKSLNHKQKLIIQESLNVESVYDATNLIKYLIKFSLSVQLIGTILLSFSFIKPLGIIKGIYYSMFHAISAFNNAGFSLFEGSLTQFSNNTFVLSVIMILIVMGGLGFIVWHNIHYYKKSQGLYLHTKITLYSVLFLIITSFLYFYIAETNNLLVNLSLKDNIFNTLFLAITPRTAGFYSLDYTNLTLASKFLLIILMFVGGSSGSIAGGVKITTIFVLFFYVFKSIFNESVIIMKYKISEGQIKKSVLVFVSSLIVVLIASLIMFISENIESSVGIEYVLIEVFSTFSTVGLTMGLSYHLSIVGKIISIFLMFVGRIGLITFILSLGKYNSNKAKVSGLPDAHIIVG